MTKWESDLVTSRDATGTPDLLDVWYDENVPSDQDWADYMEMIFDPDDPFGSQHFVVVMI
jgi:hypothetical protein